MQYCTTSLSTSTSFLFPIYPFHCDVISSSSPTTVMLTTSNSRSFSALLHMSGRRLVVNGSSPSKNKSPQDYCKLLHIPRTADLRLDISLRTPSKNAPKLYIKTVIALAANLAGFSSRETKISIQGHH